jgi:biopolymer transport protein ExbB/TolQ
MIDILLNYIQSSSAITISILILLSIYFVLTIWVYIYKILSLNSKINTEKNNLDSLLLGESKISNLTIIPKQIHNSSVSKELLEVSEISLVRDASSGLSILSIISSTSPFIGLFGTVVGILESFAAFANTSKVSFATIAPVISEALIATAAGIFVAIFAYTFHQIITRKVYTFNTYIKSQINLIISRV